MRKPRLLGCNLHTAYESIQPVAAPFVAITDCIPKVTLIWRQA